MRKFFSAILIAGAVLTVSVSQAKAVVARVWANTGSQAGTVRLGWDYREDKCYVAYTEANQQSYKYQIETACNDLSTVIAHLEPGQQYKFVVSKDKVEWSGPVYVYAAKGVAPVAYQAPSATQADANATHKVGGEDVKDEFKAKTYQGCSAARQGSMMTDAPLNYDERQTGKCGVGVTNVRTVKGPNAGEITVYWNDNTASSGQYHLVYGTESGYYTMGALNVGGESNSFTVRGLESGERYYFRLVPVNYEKPVGYTYEVSDVAR